MNNEFLYDDKDPASIEAYSQNMIDKTFLQIIKENTISYNDESEITINLGGKGNLGKIIEKYFFKYECNNDMRPDFPDSRVELKVTPMKLKNDGTYSAKERLIITMINYMNDHKFDFYESHLWSKMQLILLVVYEYDKNENSELNFIVKHSKLFSPSISDLQIIKNDYNTIINKIKLGRAHELSGSDTLYLEAAPKGSNSNDRRKQPFNEVLAKPRAFALKNSYMTYILNTQILGSKDEAESISCGDVGDSFESYIFEKMKHYFNYSISDLCELFNMSFDKKPKNLEALLIYRILGIKGNKAEEFIKANIVIKTIRIGKNDRIKESMSFPAFRFKELVNEEWENSTFRTYLSETRFLFVIFKYDNNDILCLKGCQFWNIPYKDLEVEVQEVWMKTKKVLNEGLEITRRNGKNYSNLPNASENPVCHVRPHARNSEDTYELPDGRYYPKQCFWLNSSYILSQVKIDF